MPETFYTSSRYYNLPTPVCLYVRFSFPLRVRIYFASRAVKESLCRSGVCSVEWNFCWALCCQGPSIAVYWNIQNWGPKSHNSPQHCIHHSSKHTHTSKHAHVSSKVYITYSRKLPPLLGYILCKDCFTPSADNGENEVSPIPRQACKRTILDICCYLSATWHFTVAPICYWEFGQQSN